MILYVCTQGSRISIHDNQFMVSVPGEAEKIVPLGMTESVELFGNVQITTQAVSTCMYEKSLSYTILMPGNIEGA